MLYISPNPKISIQPNPIYYSTTVLGQSEMAFVNVVNAGKKLNILFCRDEKILCMLLFTRFEHLTVGGGLVGCRAGLNKARPGHMKSIWPTCPTPGWEQFPSLHTMGIWNPSNSTENLNIPPSKQFWFLLAIQFHLWVILRAHCAPHNAEKRRKSWRKWRVNDRHDMKTTDLPKFNIKGLHKTSHGKLGGRIRNP